MLFTRVLVVCVLGLASSQARAEDWPAFRGPTGQGHSSETYLPVEWSESRNIRWKTSVPGLGLSSPVIAGGRVWLTTVIAPGKAFRRVATNMVEGAMLASMAVSGGALFFRTDRYLYRITEAGRQSQ